MRDKKFTSTFCELGGDLQRKSKSPSPQVLLFESVVQLWLNGFWKRASKVNNLKMFYNISQLVVRCRIALKISKLILFLIFWCRLAWFLSVCFYVCKIMEGKIFLSFVMTKKCRALIDFYKMMVFPSVKIFVWTEK